jgi:hypothetical protein
MDKFELVDVGVKDGCTFKIYMCKADVHKFRVSREDAKLRGIEDRYIEDDKGGYVWVVLPAKKIHSQARFEKKRVGKKLEVIKYIKEVVRCPDCGQSEEICILSSDEKMFDVFK